MVRAVRDRAVCMVNPFRCKLLHKKASLAVLSDERNARLFAARERAAIERVHPVDPGGRGAQTTLSRDEPIDLLPFMAEPARAIGPQAQRRLRRRRHRAWAGPSAREQWEAAIRRAVTSPTSCRNESRFPPNRIPAWWTGPVQVVDRMLDTAPFVCFGEYMDGCLTRLSTAALLNVTAGGGSTVPVFVVEGAERT